MKRVFAQRRAAEKAAEEKKAAARRAAAEKKALVQRAAEEARKAAEAWEAEERHATEAWEAEERWVAEAREILQRPMADKVSEKATIGSEDSTDHIPLRQGKRKAVSEGTDLILSGLLMLVDAYEKMVHRAKAEADRAQVAQELLKRIKGELVQTRKIHEQTVDSLKTASEVAYQQLYVVQADLGRARAEADAARLKVEATMTELEAAQTHAREAMTEASTSKARADAAVAALETQLKAEKEWQATFLLSMEFKKAVDDQAYAYFKAGFSKCREQFEKAGLIPTDKENFPDLDKAINSLPDEAEENSEKKDIDAVELEDEDMIE